MITRILICSATIWISAFSCKSNKPKNLDDDPASYLNRRKAFSTRLLREGPAPQKGDTRNLPSTVKEVRYKSPAGMMRAWIQRPTNAKSPAPALVYFHGGFAFGTPDITDCKAFLDAGFIVFVPSLRGENGNPGMYQMLLGEVDDAKAAVSWLAAQPYVDSKKIFAFGHSSGGGLAALISLHNTPLVATGSAGGIYPPAVIKGWTQYAPFDTKRAGEAEMRALPGNIKWMKKPHYAFVGKNDYLINTIKETREEANKYKHGLLHIQEVEGNHHTSLPLAMEKYLKIVQDIITTRSGH